MRSGQLNSIAELIKLYHQLKPRVYFHDFVAFACRARRIGRNPPALFQWYLKHGGHISGQDDDEARRMIRAYRGKPSKIAKDVAGALCAPRPQSTGERRQELDQQFYRLTRPGRSPQ